MRLGAIAGVLFTLLAATARADLEVPRAAAIQGAPELRLIRWGDEHPLALSVHKKGRDGALLTRRWTAMKRVDTRGWFDGAGTYTVSVASGGGRRTQVRFDADESLLAVEIEALVTKPSVIGRLTATRVRAGQNAELVRVWDPSATARPRYTLRNAGTQTLFGVHEQLDGFHLTGIIERRLDDGWARLPREICGNGDGTPASVSPGTSLAISEGVTAEGAFAPGRYRFVLRYSVVERDYFDRAAVSVRTEEELVSEFEIPSPGDQVRSL